MFLRLYSIVVFTAVSVASNDELVEGCWPYNVIPYSIGKGFSKAQVQWIQHQIRVVHRLTCVRWVDISENNLNVTNYTVFTKLRPRKCHSYGQQSNKGYVAHISLGDICFQFASAVIHEMLHVMGFKHEHQRSDRDCYIDINYERVAATGKASQYKIIPGREWLERFPYDKRSVMHYRRDNRMKARTERWYQYEPLGNMEGRLTDFDQWKIRYKFCNEPHYCDVYPLYCEEFDRVEKDCRKNSSYVTS